MPLIMWPLMFILPGVVLTVPIWFFFARGRIQPCLWDRLIFILPGAAWLFGWLLNGGHKWYGNMLVEPAVLLPVVPMYFGFRIYAGRRVPALGERRVGAIGVGVACVAATAVGALWREL